MSAYVKCNKPKVKVCGYRFPDGKCAPKSAWPTMFECFEKEPLQKKAKP